MEIICVFIFSEQKVFMNLVSRGPELRGSAHRAGASLLTRRPAREFSVGLCDARTRVCAVTPQAARVRRGELAGSVNFGRQLKQCRSPQSRPPTMSPRAPVARLYRVPRDAQGLACLLWGGRWTRVDEFYGRGRVVRRYILTAGSGHPKVGEATAPRLERRARRFGVPGVRGAHNPPARAMALVCTR